MDFQNSWQLLGKSWFHKFLRNRQKKHPRFFSSSCRSSLFIFFNFRTFHQICFYSAHYHDVGCGFHRSWTTILFAKQEMAFALFIPLILIFVAGPKHFHRQNDQSKNKFKGASSVFFCSLFFQIFWMTGCFF